MRTLLPVALLAVATLGAQAGDLVVDPSYLEGFVGSAFTLSIVPEEGEVFRGIDASFVGRMNQEVGQRSFPFTNYDLFLPFGGAYDSKFLYASGEILSIGVEDSESYLGGAISGLADLPQRPFARIVIPFGSTVEYSLDTDLGGIDPQRFTGTLVGLPEPSTCLLSGLMLIGLATRRVG